ncbi:MAG: hypothetical protein QM817_27720 [Archangium sp.]
MKYRLERGAERLEVVRHGRVVTLEWGDGRSEDRGAFDERAAEEQLQVLIDSLFHDGWVESEEMQRERAEKLEREARRERLQTMTAAFAAREDPREGFRELTGAWLPHSLIPFIERLEHETDGGVLVRLTTGALLMWERSLDESLLSCSLYPDEEAYDAGEFCVSFAEGEDCGPPEQPEEVGTVMWFLSTWPNEDYWFTRIGEPRVAHKWMMDGGLREDGRTPQAVLDAVLLHWVEK